MANWIFLLSYLMIIIIYKMSVVTPFFYLYDHYDYYYYYDNFTSNSSSEHQVSDLKLGQVYKDVVRKTLPRVLNLCPEMRMTDTLENPPSNVTHMDFNGTSCCKPCSVSDDCNTMHNFNFCCPQAEMAFYDVYTKETAFCSSTGVYYSTDFKRFPEYMIVEDCRKYELYPENAFDDIVMVLSNGVLYRNKHLAKCNGETEFIRWQLLATGCDFPAIIQNTRRDALFPSIMAQCFFYSAPPKGFDPSHFLCHDYFDMIHMCNVTGLWDEYEKEIEFLCNVAISAAHDNDGRVYRNVFCLACNQPSSFLETPQTCESPWSHKPAFNGSVYTILPDDYLQNNTDSFCDTIDVLDIYQNKCRSLYCPSRQLPYNGKCLDTPDEPSVFEIVLRISPSYLLMGLAKDISTDNHEANNAQLLSYFGLLQVCKVQSNYLYSYRSVESQISADFVIYDLRLNISSICNESFLSLKLRKPIDKFQLQVGQTYLNVTVQRTIPLLYDPLIHTMETIATFHDNSCGTCLIKRLIPLDCPYISLQLTEFCYLYKKKHDKTSCWDISTQDWFKEYVAFGDDIVDGVWNRVFFICVHQYNTIFLDKSSNENVETLSPSSQSASLNVNGTLYIFVAFLALFLL